MRESYFRIHGIRLPIELQGSFDSASPFASERRAVLRMTEDLCLSALSVELLGQQLIHHLRIRLALRSFHDLADEKADNRLFRRAILFDLLGIGRYNIV